MSDCHSTPTPAATKLSPTTKDQQLYNNPTLFRSTIPHNHPSGHHFYSKKLYQTMYKTYNLHLQQLKQLLRYLKGTSNYGIKITPNNLTLTAFSDSDWAGDNTDRKSTTGYCIMLANTPISWASKKQKAMARSSTEAKYRTLATTSSEIVWLRKLLGELGIPCTIATTIYCDNISAISLAQILSCTLKQSTSK